MLTKERAEWSTSRTGHNTSLSSHGVHIFAALGAERRIPSASGRQTNLIWVPILLKGSVKQAKEEQCRLIQRQNRPSVLTVRKADIYCVRDWVCEMDSEVTVLYCIMGIFE